MSAPAGALRILAVSPHLDDAAFSAGGLLAALGAAGARVAVATVFTRSVPDPVGVALTGQPDRELAASIDHLALRRAEDLAAMRHLGVHDVHHLDLPEAPHRGYVSTPDLFAGVHQDDGVGLRVQDLLTPLVAAADVVLGPLALGGHADHVIVRDAVRAVAGDRVAWWRDAPYALKLETGLGGRQVPWSAADVTDVLPTKLAACASYSSQLGSHFGGPEGMVSALTRFAALEARRAGLPVERRAERLATPPGLRAPDLWAALVRPARSG